MASVTHPGFASPQAMQRFQHIAPHLEADVPLVRHVATFGLHFAPDCLEAVEALAAVIRITRGNFRLMERLFAQMQRIMSLNRVDAVSSAVAEAARDCLVIGAGD